MLGYAIDVTPKHVVTQILYGDDAINAVALCSFTCEPDTHGQHEFIIRYNSSDTGFCYEHGFNILYKNPDMYCFEYAADGLNVDKVFKPFVNILRNTLNYELYQSLPQFQDTAITAPTGLMTKEVFVLDTSYFVIGDIYLLEIDPAYDWSKISTTPIKFPRRVYAICEDVCSTSIDFMFGGIEGRDDLLRIPVHADFNDYSWYDGNVYVENGIVMMSDKKEYGDGLLALTNFEVLQTVMSELYNLRMFWPNFFNIKFDIDPRDSDITFNIDFPDDGTFCIDIQNQGFYVGELEYQWCGGSNSNMLNFNCLDGHGDITDRINGICLRDNNTNDPKINYWNEDGLKTSNIPLLYEFISRIYSALYGEMRDKWIKEQAIEEKHQMQYNGIMARPIFDPQFLEPGALLQIHVLKERSTWATNMWRSGIYYNCFVTGQDEMNTKLNVIRIDYRSGSKSTITEKIDVKDITEGYLEIIRVK